MSDKSLVVVFVVVPAPLTVLLLQASFQRQLNLYGFNRLISGMLVPRVDPSPQIVTFFVVAVVVASLYSRLSSHRQYFLPPSQAQTKAPTIIHAFCAGNQACAKA